MLFETFSIELHRNIFPHSAHMLKGISLSCKAYIESIEFFLSIEAFCVVIMSMILIYTTISTTNNNNNDAPPITAPESLLNLSLSEIIRAPLSEIRMRTLERLRIEPRC